MKSCLLYTSGAKGDVIDLVARLFDLSSYEAAQKLAADFGLDPKPPTAAAMVKMCIRDRNEVADNMYQRSELDYLIYNDPIGYADLILNGNLETYLKTVTEYKPLDS